MFGFRKQHQSSLPRPVRNVFAIGLLMLFLLFFGIHKLNILAQLSVGEQAQFAQKLSWGVSQDMSKLAGSAGRLYQVIQSGGAFLDNKQDIDTVVETIKHNTTIEKLVPEEYKGLYYLAKKWVNYKEDVLDLFGPDRVRTYLVALMNNSEIRPNGGFFGSYAIVQFYKGKLVQYKVYDSYYAYYQNSGAKIPLDANYADILGQSSINFISPNVYGFTSLDGANIKMLYEQLFPSQNLDGVILLSSNLLEQLLPDLGSKMVDWQFTNACADLIRGEMPNKKQQYLTDIGDYLEKNKNVLYNQIINNLPYVLSSRLIQVYLPKSSSSFQEFLAQETLRLDQNTDDMYIWHMNKSFNKIDKFVSKRFILQDTKGNVVAESNDGIMNVDQYNLDEREYDLFLYYTLSVPQSYVDQIYGLTKQYDIELTPRETHILGLSYNRQNQVIIHLPSDMKFQAIDGAYFCNNQGRTSKTTNVRVNDCYTLVEGKYNQIVSFQVLGFGNDSLKVVRIRLIKY